jgi:MEMO1 family protein
MKVRITLFLGVILVISQAFLPGDGKIRQPVDKVGFATNARQMNQVVARINKISGTKIEDAWKLNGIKGYTSWRTVICPHDDYTYAGWLYPAVLKNINAGTIILFGVAHKAKKFNIEDKIVFGSHDGWAEPYGVVRVSALRESIMRDLPKSFYIVSDSLQEAEHSLEAIIPFLQYYNRNIEIVPVLVPYMSFDRMKSIAGTFSMILTKIMKDNDYTWSRDIAIVISTDAVHYGCEDWGGSDYAFYGCDSAGYKKAVQHEYEIINTSLTGDVTPEKISRFSEYTVQDTNYHAYKWTWCGRYSVPFGLLVSNDLAEDLHSGTLKGTLIGYANSIDHDTIPVADLKMGKTTIANMRHWVGYAGIGYK